MFKIYVYIALVFAIVKMVEYYDLSKDKAGRILNENYAAKSLLCLVVVGAIVTYLGGPALMTHLGSRNETTGLALLELIILPPLFFKDIICGRH